jgi:hypothetical protein
MQTPTFPAIQSKSFSEQESDQISASGLFDFGSVAEVVRSLFFSSILWMILAVVLYGVYTMVLGSH